MGAHGELTGILETALSFDHADSEATLAFYRETLGLREVSSWREGTVFRLGSGVLLLFDRELLAENDSPVAQHGSSGIGHICFLAAPDTYDSMRERLAEAGVGDRARPRVAGGRALLLLPRPGRQPARGRERGHLAALARLLVRVAEELVDVVEAELRLHRGTLPHRAHLDPATER